MQFTLTIQCDGAAFFTSDGEPDAATELARILRDTAERIDSSGRVIPGKLYDVNGNRVGEYFTSGGEA